MKITEEKLEYLRQNLSKTSLTKLADKLGVKPSTIVRWARKVGYVTQSRTTHKLPPKDVYNEIVKLYPDVPAPVIMDKFGVSEYIVRHIAKRENLCKTELGIKKAHESQSKAMRGKPISEEHKHKISKGLKKTFDRERARIALCLPKLTKHRINGCPVKWCKARWWLRSQYGYMWDKEQPFVLYYDDETNRSKEREQYFSDQYKCTFLPLNK